MNANARLVDQLNIVSAVVPVNAAAGAQAGDYVSLKGYEKCSVVYFGAVGAAGEDIVLTFEQAKTVAGLDVKPLSKVTRIAQKQGTALTAVTKWTDKSQAASDTYTDTDSGENQQVVVIDIPATALDVENGFDCLRVSVNDPGTTAKLNACLYILWPPRYGQKPGAEVSPILD